MVVYFCFFSLIGHLLEWPYCYIGATFFNSMDPLAEVITNPFKPFLVYGFGIVACAIFLAPLKDWLLERMPKGWQALLIFYIFSIFLGMAGELIQGFLQNQPVNGVYPLWDVSNYPGNILGQAWIVNDILLGVVFTFATWHIYPMCELRLNTLQGHRAEINAIIVLVIWAILMYVTYVIIPPTLP